MSIIKQTYFDQHGTVAGNAIQRLNGIISGLEELDRRITMQLDMLEI